MLIYSGRINALGIKPWAGIELVSDATIEDRVQDIIGWLRKTFRSEPFQLVYPVKEYRIKGVQLLSPYLWVRAEKLAKIRGVSTLYGVEGLVTDPGNKIIEVGDDFVQNVIAEAKKAKAGWSDGVKKGSFVRVLKGRTRMLCGEVKKIDKGIADVIVSMRLRDLKLKVPVSILLNLGDKPGEYFQGEE